MTDSGICPHCGQSLPLRSNGIDNRIDALRAWLTARGYWIGPGDSVTEDAAAAALGRSANTLRFWRGADRRLRFHRSGNRIRYQLQDLANFEFESGDE